MRNRLDRPMTLPDLELECIKVLWDHGDQTVRGVRDYLQSRRVLAYTTVLTLLDRLAAKGAVSRQKVHRAYVYHAVYTREQARETAVSRVLDHYFGGSAHALADYLAAPPKEGTRSAGV